MDDILIFTNSLEEHRRITREVLKILRDNHLFLKVEKCEFERREIEYLGLVIHQGQVSMDSTKVKAVQDWPRPTNKHELQQFLGSSIIIVVLSKDSPTLLIPFITSPEIINGIGELP